MFRILIVDDERIVLNGIRMMIEQNLGLGFSVDIVTVSNVPQAMELCHSFEPDLVLTDIRMPVMDGFALIRYMREKNYDGSIVILTSHADFSYAQQAIQLNVMDFILKPIDQQVLKATIERVYGQKKERDQFARRSTLMELRNMMLYDLSPQELLCDSDSIHQLFPHTFFTVVVLVLPNIKENYSEILNKILSSYYDICMCFSMQERGQVIAICNHGKFHVQSGKIRQEIHQAVGDGDVWIGISISASSYKLLNSLYINALQRVFYARHMGEDRMLTEISVFTYQDCVRIFAENDEQKVQQLMQEYFTKIKATSETPDILEMIYRSFTYNIQLYLENNHIHIPAEQLGEVCQAKNYQELMTCIVAKLRLIRQSVQKNYEHYENDTVISQLLTYIQQHYQRDISLDDLADHVKMHPNYVCTLFRKNVGMSYLVCLHRERLAAAKTLLAETDRTVEQIAEAVGYNSASQLARVFRKYEGKSPSSYRAKTGNEQRNAPSANEL